MNLTIVVTTYNRAASVKALLCHLENQNDKDFQVVFAIDGSTDRTEEILAESSPSFDLKWVNTHCQKYGLAVARNQGIIAADGDAVVILDDDSVPEPNFVAAHKMSVRPGTITGGPRISADMLDTRLVWKMAELARMPALTPMSIDQIRRDWPKVFLIENNICLLRQDWIDIGLFSERLKLYGFIGQEFFARAKFSGYGYQYNPEASVVHHGHIEGDNGFFRSRKVRQTRMSTALRPSLETPGEFLRQIEWARQYAKMVVSPSDPLAVPLTAWLALPYRLARNEAAKFKRRLSRMLA